MIRFFALLWVLSNCEADHISLTVSHWALPMKQHIHWVSQPGPSPARNHQGGLSTHSPEGCPQWHVLCPEARDPAWARWVTLSLSLNQGRIHPQPLLILSIQTLSFSSMYWLPLRTVQSSCFTQYRGEARRSVQHSPAPEPSSMQGEFDMEWSWDDVYHLFLRAKKQIIKHYIYIYMTES